MKIMNVITVIFLVLLSQYAMATEEQGTGFIANQVYNPERNKSIEIHYWYPTQNIISDFEFGNSKIFLTEKATLNAELLNGKFPVILLAHGGMRASPYHSGWIASALAKRGYIVVVPQPPRPNELKPSLAPHELWLRPSDLKLGLSSLDDVSIIKNGVDKSNILGLGFFLGGTSMLSLAGAKIDPELYKNSCVEKGVNFDCQWFQKNGVDLSDFSVSNLLSTKPDARIKSVIAINPELSKTFDKNSVTGISIPLTIIALGDTADSRDNSYLALKPSKQLGENKNVTFSTIPNTSVYSAFSICTHKGKIILAAEGDDDICNDLKGLTREQAHQVIVDEVVKILK